MDRLILLCIFLFCSCFLPAQEVNYLTKKEVKQAFIDMGMRNLPEFFFDHYYRYPKSVKEFYSFLQNHYDYTEAKEAWEPFIEYLKQNKNEINIISVNGLFIIYDSKHMSYSRGDICNIMALHHPEKEYADYVSQVNFYDLNGRNVKELIGVERADSITIFFNKLKQNIYDSESINSYPEENSFVQYDKFRRVLLQYEPSCGMQIYCSQETLIISDYPFFDRLESLCHEFCKQWNLSKIIFNSLVFKQKKKTM